MHFMVVFYFVIYFVLYIYAIELHEHVTVYLCIFNFMDVIFDFYIYWIYFELWAEPVEFGHNGLVGLIYFIGYFEDISVIWG